MSLSLDKPVHWSRRRIIYVLSYLSEFRSGKIPDYRETGYTTAPHVFHSIKAMASFIPAVEMAAEATLRVERAGDDGYIVMCIYANGVEARTIARLIHQEERDVWRRVGNALGYASDDNCLIESYHGWRKRRHK